MTSVSGAPVRGVVAIRALLVGLCIVGAVAALVAYRSERRVDEIEQVGLDTIDAERSNPGRLEALRREGLALVDGARLLNPDTGIDVQIGLFLEADKRRAGDVLRRAIRREPENVFLWLVLSQKQRAEGRPAAAARTYAHARALDPRLPRPR